MYFALLMQTHIEPLGFVHLSFNDVRYQVSIPLEQIEYTGEAQPSLLLKDTKNVNKGI